MTPAPFWTLDRVADALRGRACAPLPSESFPRGTAELAGVATDTRTIAPGACFVALVGERFDAHDFLDRAVEAGAGALVVNRAPEIGRFGVPVYVVDDTLVALGDLASYWRAAWGKPVVGIAGSNGKTTTKELVRAALGGAYAVHATSGNLNNRIGVPLTLLGIPPEADIAVVEIGTSLPGEVATLRDIVRPDVAVVTSIAEEHLEGLGDLAGVLREEAAVFDGAPIAIAPTAQPEIAEAARDRAEMVTTAGLDDGDLRCDAWSVARDGRGVLVVKGITVEPPLRGVHNLQNTMLALAVARCCGVALEVAAAGIAAMPVPSMRTAWQQVGRATVINDAYNSNPGSARAAIAMLGAAHGAQRVAVLGTMRELGADSARYHDDVARAALESPVELIAGIGEFRDALARLGAGDPRVLVATDVDDLWPALEPRLERDATILLKASRGVQLERMLPHITSWASA